MHVRLSDFLDITDGPASKNKVRRAEQLAHGETPNDMDDIIEDDANYGKTIMMKVIGPVVKFVDRPWKVGHHSSPQSSAYISSRCILWASYSASVRRHWKVTRIEEINL